MERVAATHSLDACAVIAYLHQEPGADVLKALIELPTTFLAMHICNLGEVYYDFFREDGITAAQTAWTNTLALPLALRRDTDDTFGVSANRVHGFGRFNLQNTLVVGA